MNYILRFVVHENLWQRQLAELTELCRSTPVTEVMLMEESHQILTSAFLLPKHRRMANIYRRFAAALAEIGVGYSVNLATTVGHGDNLVGEEKLLPFQHFMGEGLTESHSVYCIADKAWAEYTASIAALYAATKPLRLMIDDDFRSLNHSCAIGCFCPLHAKLVSERIGKPFTSQQLAQALCENSEESNRIKQAWIEVNFEAQMYAAQSIEAAVHAACPSTQLGLMNSGEPSHSLQGRDMPRLLAAFAGDGRQGLSRPAGWAYSDCLHGDVVMMHQMTALSMHAAPSDVYWVSEVENYPHTLYTKSLRVTRLQMQMHALCGVNALTMNFYDYLATPLSLQPDMAQLLRESAPRIDEIARLRQGKQLRGVGLLWRANTAACQQNRTGTTSGLIPIRPHDSILPQLGIPVQFSEGDVNLLLGDSVLCYTREELLRLLAKGLLVDNIAAAHFEKMGLGEYLGVGCIGQITVPCVEQMTASEHCGSYTGTLLCTNWSDIYMRGEWISRLQPAPDAQVISTLLSDELEPLSPAITLYQNAMGGRVCVFALPMHESGWLFAARAVVMRSLIQTMIGPSVLPLIYGRPNLAPFYYEDTNGSGGLLALVNCGLDEEAVDLPVGYQCTGLFEANGNETAALPPLTARFYTTERII